MNSEKRAIIKEQYMKYLEEMLPLRIDQRINLKEERMHIIVEAFTYNTVYWMNVDTNEQSEFLWIHENGEIALECNREFFGGKPIVILTKEEYDQINVALGDDWEGTDDERYAHIEAQTREVLRKYDLEHIFDNRNI